MCCACNRFLWAVQAVLLSYTYFYFFMVAKAYSLKISIKEH